MADHSHGYSHLVGVVVEAMITSLSPTSSHTSRQAAETMISQLKNSEQGIAVLLAILGNKTGTVYTNELYMMSCYILGDAVKLQYPKLMAQQQTTLRNELFSLLEPTNGQAMSTILSNKVMRIKYAVILSYVIENQYPSLWPTFIDDCTGLWLQGSSINMQILVMMVFETILEDCIDTDYNSLLTTVQRRDLLQGFKTKALLLLTTSCQYFSYLYQQYILLLTNSNSLPDQKLHEGLLEDGLNTLLRMLSPLLTHIKPLTHPDTLYQGTPNSADPAVQNENQLKQQQEVASLNESILHLTTSCTLKASTMKCAIKLLNSFALSEKLDLSSILLVMKYILNNSLVSPSDNTCFIATVLSDDPSEQLFYQNMYTTALYRLISNNIREIYIDNNRNKSLLQDNQDMIIRYFQLLVALLQQPIVSYHLSSELIADWSKIFKEYPKSSIISTDPSLMQGMNASTAATASFVAFPWLEEIIPILLRFYYEKSRHITWGSDTSNKKWMSSYLSQQIEILEVEFDEFSDYQEFYGTFKSQVRTLYQIIAMTFPSKALQGCLMLLQDLSQNQSIAYSLEDEIVLSWSSLSSLVECLLQEILSHYIHSITAAEQQTKTTSSGIEFFSSSILTLHPNLSLQMTIMMTIVELLLTCHSKPQNVNVVVSRIKCLQYSSITIQLFYQLARVRANIDPSIYNHFNPMNKLLQIFQIFFGYYKLENLSFEMHPGNASNSSTVYELLVVIIGTSANAISELCAMCHEMMLLSCNQRAEDASNPFLANMFPIQDFISFICEILSLNHIAVPMPLSNVLSTIYVPIYVKTSLRDSLVVLSDRITMNQEIKNQLLSIALGNVIQNWSSFTAKQSDVMTPLDSMNIRNWTPQQSFSSNESLLRILCYQTLILNEQMRQGNKTKEENNDIIQETIGILRYLISSAKRVTVPSVPDDIWTSNASIISTNTIRQTFPYIDVWIASMSMIFDICNALHDVWHPLFQYQSSKNIIMESGLDISMKELVYLPSYLEIIDVLGNTITSNRSVSKSIDVICKYLWNIRLQLKQIRTFMYQLLEKAIYHKIFLFSDLLPQTNEFPSTMTVLDSFVWKMIQEWMPNMENEHFVLFLKTFFDPFVLHTIIPSKYVYFIEIMVFVLKHSIYRLNTAYNPNGISLTSDLDRYHCHLYHENCIPKGFRYNQLIQSMQTQFGIVFTEEDNFEISEEMVELSKGFIIANVAKQLADTLAAISCCKGYLSKSVSHVNATTAASSSSPSPNQEGYDFNMSFQSGEKDMMNSSSTATTMDILHIRRWNLRNLLLFSSPDLLENYLSLLSMLMKLTIMETCKKSVQIIHEFILERCVITLHEENCFGSVLSSLQQSPYHSTPAACSLSSSYIQSSPHYQRIIEFLSQDVFSIGCYILLRNASWSVGLEWEIISLLSQIYWFITLGQKNDETTSSAVNPSTSSSIGFISAPKTANTSISIAPRQILLRLPCVTTQMIEQLEFNLLSSHNKKQRREIFRDLLIQFISLNKSQSSNHNAHSNADPTQLDKVGSILEMNASSDSMKSNQSVNGSQNQTKGKNSMPNIVELGDCDLNSIFK